MQQEVVLAMLAKEPSALAATSCARGCATRSAPSATR